MPTALKRSTTKEAKHGTTHIARTSNATPRILNGVSLIRAAADLQRWKNNHTTSALMSVSTLPRSLVALDSPSSSACEEFAAPGGVNAAPISVPWTADMLTTRLEHCRDSLYLSQTPHGCESWSVWCR